MEVPALLDLALKMKIPRFCVYHLAPIRRGKHIASWDISKAEREKVLAFLYEKAIELRDW
ncbi:MAG: hypothetical protein QXL78_03995 [Methanocellales archaeon]